MQHSRDMVRSCFISQGPGQMSLSKTQLGGEWGTLVITRWCIQCHVGVFRTAADFGSALDSVWPFFAAMGCKRTSKTDLIRLDIIKKVLDPA